MARRSRMEQKVYQTGGSPWRFLSYGMIFVSCMLLISGLFGPGSAPADLTVVPSFTPAPTVVADVFDETPASRQITVDSGKWYAIQLGIYGSADSADAQAQAYKQRGAAGYVWQEDERYRVLAAVYPLEEDAKAVRQQLREGQNIDSYVYAIESTTLTLRLTGMAGQLDALEA
ncbi:MAG: SPOR domain-containing protein, partial [Clostridia bacterium]|nr:SPOR domain-containing protein [Clostridia bacterium]